MEYSKLTTYCALILLLLITQISSTTSDKNLLDAEIAELENLISLYEQKIEILKGSKVQTQNDQNLFYVEDQQLDLIVNQSSEEISKSQLQKEELYQINQLIEMIFLTETEVIIAYEFITIKPLGKSPNGYLVQSAIAIALENGIIRVYDIYGNQLLEILVGEEITQIASSQNQDDMFITVLTKDGKFYIYTLELERKFNIYRDKFHELKNGSLVDPDDIPDRHTVEEDAQRYETIDSIVNKTKDRKDKKTKSKKQDDQVTKYQSLLKMYEYHPKLPVIVDLNSIPKHNSSGTDTNDETVVFSNIMVYQNRGDKFFIISDSQGYFTILKRDGEFRSRFYSGSKNIINMSKYQLNIAFSTDRKVGFLKFVDSSIGPIMCDSGLKSLVGAYLDQNYAGMLYAGTKEGEILLYETQGTMLKPDNIDCKHLGRVQTNLYYTMKAENKIIDYDFRPIKGGLVIYTQQGIFEYFNITEVYGLMTQNQDLPKLYVPNFSSREDQLIQGQVKIADAKIQNGNLLLVRVPGTKNKLALYDCLFPYLRHDTFLDAFNFKFPMFIIAFAVVIIYQIYKKKTNSNQEDDGTLASQFEKRGQRLGPKAKADLNEIEKMMKDLGGIGSEMKGLSKQTKRKN